MASMRQNAFRAMVAACLGLIGLATQAAFAQPDIRLCQLYGPRMTFGNPAQPARVGDTVGFAVGTTSWNIGNVRVNWLNSPNANHPVIAQNLYRLQDGRLQQIGQSWVKHGFFALWDTQCGGSCQVQSFTGDYLYVGCTDTYDPGLNGQQSGLGPRSEINPWTGEWNFNQSIFQTGMANNAITRRLQVNDADLIAFDSSPGGNPTGVRYFIEAYYVAADDRDAMNSGAWREVTSISGSPGNTWTMNVGTQGGPLNVGFTIDAWGPRQTIVAEDPALIEHVVAAQMGGSPSPDGRSVLCSKVTDNGNGTWRYEYAILNVDMDRQVRSFSVEIPNGVTVSNIGSYAVRHHNEPNAWSEWNGVSRVYGKAIDNSPWTSSSTRTNVTWSTPGVLDPEPSNPIRWGTMHNFWFDADTPPTDVMATLGLFKTGSPDSLQAATDGPSAIPPCPGDANGDMVVDFDDITAVLANWLNNYAPGTGLGDADGNGIVDFDDITAVLAQWLVPCP